MSLLSSSCSVLICKCRFSHPVFPYDLLYFLIHRTIFLLRETSFQQVEQISAVISSQPHSSIKLSINYTLNCKHFIHYQI